MAKKEPPDDFEEIDLNSDDKAYRPAPVRSENPSFKRKISSISNLVKPRSSKDSEIIDSPERQLLIDEIQFLQDAIEILREMYKETVKLVDRELTKLESNEKGHYKRFKTPALANFSAAFNEFKKALEQLKPSSNIDLSKSTDEELNAYKNELQKQFEKRPQEIFTAACQLENNAFIKKSHLAQKNIISRTLKTGLSKLFEKLHDKFPAHFPDPVPHFLQSSAQRTTKEITKKIPRPK